MTVPGLKTCYVTAENSVVCAHLAGTAFRTAGRLRQIRARLMARQADIRLETDDPRFESVEHRPADASDLRDSFYEFVVSNLQFTHPEGGTPTKLETTFHDVVAFRTTAVRCFEWLAKQDCYVTQSQLDTVVDEDTGVQRT